MPKAFDPDLGYVPCGKRHGNALERCTLKEGHEREELRRARMNQPQPRQPLPQKTPAKMDDDEIWAYIKRCFIAALGKRFCAHASHSECYGRIELDHILAKGDGGKSVPENAQLLCKKHHDIKHGNVLKWTKAPA